MMEVQAPIPPDGGYGWIIVFCSFFIHAVCHGITLALGVLVVSWLNTFDSGKSETSWIVSIAVAVMYGIGPFAAALAQKIGYRAMAIAGSILMSVGLFLSSYANSVFALMLTIGVIAGAGFGLAYLSAIAVPAFYFDKKRSMAMGLGTAGSGAGVFLLAPLMNGLVDAYGWRGTLLFLSGICLNVCVVAALMRPLPAPRNPVPKQVIRVADVNIEAIDDVMETDALINSHESILTDSGKGSSLDDVAGASNENLKVDSAQNLAALAMSNESVQSEGKRRKKKLSFAGLDNQNPSETSASKELPVVVHSVEALEELLYDKNNNNNRECQNRSALQEIDLNQQNIEETAQNKQNAEETVHNKQNTEETVQNKETVEKKETMLKHKEVSLRKKSYTNKPVKGGPFHHYKSDQPSVTRKHSTGHNQKHHAQKDKRYSNKNRTNINLMLEYTSPSKPPCTYIHIMDLSDERFLGRLEKRKLFSHDNFESEVFGRPRSCSDHQLVELPGLSVELLPPSIELVPEVKDIPMGGSMQQLTTTLPSELDVEASREFRSVIELNTRTPGSVERAMSSIRPRDVYHSGSIYNLMALERTLTQSKRSLYRSQTDRPGSSRHSFNTFIRSGGDLSMYRRKRAPDEPSMLQQLKQGIKANINLLKDATFLLFAVSNFLTNLSLVMPMVFMVDRAISLGITKESAALLISLNGAGTICGRVLCSLVADRSWMNRLFAYITTLTLAGIATSFSPLCGGNLALHGLYASSFGLLAGNYGALCACVLVDLKGLDSVGQSYGLLLLFMGISTLMGTPLGGLIYDISGGYKIPYILHGAFITASGLILVPLLFKLSRCRQNK